MIEWPHPAFGVTSASKIASATETSVSGPVIAASRRLDHPFTRPLSTPQGACWTSVVSQEALSASPQFVLQRLRRLMRHRRPRASFLTAREGLHRMLGYARIAA